MQKEKTIKYYENSNQATLYSFRMVIETGDYTHLVYQGNPKEADSEKLAIAWFNIYSEFSKVINDSSIDLAFAEEKRKEAKKHKINVLSILVNFLENSPEQDVINEIEKWGYVIDTSDAGTYIESLRGVVSQIEKMKLQLKEPEKENKNEGNLNILITELERFQGYSFNEKEMSVNKFASIYKRFKDYGRGKNK